MTPEVETSPMAHDQRINAPPSSRIGEWVFLILLIVAVSAVNVPSQWTGIATDPSFTAWIAPLSNRMKDGLRLYDAHGHMPLPPLSHVFILVVSNGHATWITESFWHHCLTGISLLLLYWRMAKDIPGPGPLLGTVGALATFSSCDTILLYNSMANFWATVAVVVVVSHIRAIDIESNGPTRNDVVRLAGLGFCCAATVLTKQSIGGLTSIGVAAALLCAGRSKPSRNFRDVLLVIGFSAVAFVGLCLLMSPWVDPIGMIQDVFLNGSECKGGTREIVRKLFSYGIAIGNLLGSAGLAILVGYGIVSACGYTVAIAPSRPSPFWRPSLLLNCLACLVGIGLAFVPDARLRLTPARFGDLICTFGLMIGLFAAVYSGWTVVRRVQRGVDPRLRSAGALTLVLLPAAMGYSLSGGIGDRTFYFNIHTMPILQAALSLSFALLAIGADVVPARIGYFTGRRAWYGLITILMLGLWTSWPAHFGRLKECTDEWPEVSWYKNARVTHRAKPIRSFVNQLRSLTLPEDEVLFLPADPNVEACFDRKSPQLSCAVIYTDTYWKQHVEADLTRLRTSPPKAIVIGPRNSWRPYARLRNDSGAVEQLIDGLDELLRSHYEKRGSHEIRYLDGVDYLDVWIRTS